MLPLSLTLDELTKMQLEKLVRTARLSYIRERASAVLKVASGLSCVQVAYHGLLQERQAATVRAWVHRFVQNGIEGLYICSGRGRKAALSLEQINKLHHDVQSTPIAYGFHCSRWTLATLLVLLNIELSPSGLWKILKRASIYYRRGQHYLHSPDIH